MNNNGSSYIDITGNVSAAEERAGFMRRVYAHLIAALAAFVGIEALFQTTLNQEAILGLFAGGRFSWLIVMLVYMGMTFLARTLAYHETSRGMQYAGLALGVVVEACIFMPIIFVARNMDPSGTLLVNAGLMTSILFAGLVATVIMTGKDFSFLKTVVIVGSIVALGACLLAVIMGINLGFWFAVAMVALMAAVILYQTSQIYRDYPAQMYVPAAFLLFTSFTTLLWYILRILMSRRD